MSSSLTSDARLLMRLTSRGDSWQRLWPDDLRSPFSWDSWQRLWRERSLNQWVWIEKSVQDLSRDGRRRRRELERARPHPNVGSCRRVCCHYPHLHTAGDEPPSLRGGKRSRNIAPFFLFFPCFDGFGESRRQFHVKDLDMLAFLRLVLEWNMSETYPRDLCNIPFKVMVIFYFSRFPGFLGSGRWFMRKISNSVNSIGLFCISGVE